MKSETPQLTVEQKNESYMQKTTTGNALQMLIIQKSG